MPELANIPLSQIRSNPVAAREVQIESEKFQELISSIKTQGVITPISVRKSNDPEKDGKNYILIDGLHRFTAAQHAGLTEIPAQVLDRTESEALMTQLVANIQRLDMKPVELRTSLVRFLGNNPAMTEMELALKLGKSPQYIRDVLSLGKLDPAIQPLVNEGKIPVGNAFALAKLPLTEQKDWVERAQTRPASEFGPQVLERSKAIQKAARQGQAAGEEQFVPIRTLRKKLDIETETDHPEIIPALVRKLNVLANVKKGDMEAAAIAGATLALQWATNFDDESKAAQKAKHEAYKAKQAEDRARAKAEREANKAAAAQTTTAAVGG